MLWGTVKISGSIGKKIKGIEEGSIQMQRAEMKPGEQSIKYIHKSHKKKVIQNHIEVWLQDRISVKMRSNAWNHCSKY